MIQRFLRVALVLGVVQLSAFVAVGGTAHADTYTVSSTLCTGPGSYVEAVNAANAHPGADIISFTPGLQLDWNSCPAADPKSSVYAVVITDAVTIEGNGVTLNGRQFWLDSSGVKSPLTRCPNPQQKEILVVANAPGLFEIGTRTADNSAVQVVVRNLTFRDASTVARVRTGASLTFDHVSLRNIVNIVGNCSENPIQTVGDAHLTFVDSDIVGFVAPGNVEPVASVAWGAIAGSGTLDLIRTRMSLNRTNGAIVWGGRVNVVSSQLADTGGIYLYAGTLEFVNSIFYISRAEGYLSDLINIAGQAYFSGSTVTGYVDRCLRTCSKDSDALLFLVSGGQLHFSSTAVGNTAEVPERSPLIRVIAGGVVTADRYTWMQPTALQDAAALKALTGQPALLTDAPGLLENGNELIDYYPAPAVPLLGSEATPGVLIDAVPDATSTNVLRDPITDLPLTVDVFGNDRVDGSGRRNIGAIQTLFTPHLMLVRAKDGTVSLAWTRPKDPPSGAITGYHVRFRPVGQPTWNGPVTVTGAGALATVITGLTNGVDHEFEVTAVNGVGDGPVSNIVTGKPFGDISAPAVVPVPGLGQVQLTWTPPTDWGGFTPGNEYFVSYNRPGRPDTVQQVRVEGTSTMIAGLTAGATYEFCVIARSPSQDTGSCARVTATVLSPGGLPETGRASGALATIAAAFLVLGCGLLLGARRRPVRHG